MKRAKRRFGDLKKVFATLPSFSFSSLLSFSPWGRRQWTREDRRKEGEGDRKS